MEYTPNLRPASDSNSEPTPAFVLDRTPAPADRPWLTPGYKLFLDKLKRTRLERGLSLAELADRMGQPVPLLERFEQGELPLDFLQTRTWVSQLDHNIALFTQELEDLLSSLLDRDEELAAPTPAEMPDAEDENEENDAAAPKEATLEVLVFWPRHTPQICVIPNTLDAMQAVVHGLITVVHIDVPGCVAVANDEALLEGMPLNLIVPATQAPIFGSFFVALDVAGGFGSLGPEQIELVLDALAPKLSQAEYQRIVKSHSKGEEWTQSWE